MDALSEIYMYTFQQQINYFKTIYWEQPQKSNREWEKVLP